MPALDASAPARDAIDEFLRHLADRDLSSSTRRIRKTFLNEYLRHAQQAAGAEHPLTARDLLDGERAAAWLADAAEGKTRTRNTLRGPDAAAYPNSMRVRADTVNAFAEFLGEPGRVARQAPPRGYPLAPGDTERLLHELTVKRPIHANAMTALRTAAVAAVIADTGHGVPEIADLKLGSLHLDGDEARAEIDGESYPLTGSTVHILTRWLAARASIVAELEGSDPGYLWIPTKPGRPRGGVPSAKPGISPAAVRTLHASHRALVSQLLGTPLRPGALRAAAVSLSVSTGDQGLQLSAGAGAEHRPADLGPVPAHIVGVDGTDQVVLADRGVHADGALGPALAERAIGPVDLAEGALVHGHRRLDGGDLNQPHAPGRLQAAPAGAGAADRDRQERGYLTPLQFEEVARVEGAVRSGGG